MLKVHESSDSNQEVIERARKIAERQEQVNIDNGFLEHHSDEILERHPFISSKEDHSFKGELKGLTLTS